MRVLVYTANIGGHDRAWPAAQQNRIADWRYLTDDPTLVVPEPWQRRLVVVNDEHPNMRAKWFRTHPPLYAYDYCIWIDASMQVTNPGFVTQAIFACGDAPVALWRHPRRDCIYDEADASVGNEAQADRYRNVPLADQVAVYRAEGYPAHNGLYATGTIVWRNCDEARRLGDAWYAECLRWGYQDQVSFPVVAWRLGITPATFPIGQVDRYDRRLKRCVNRWLIIHEHVPGTSFADREWRHDAC